MVGVRVFVRNLPDSVGEAELRELLSRVCDVRAVSFRGATRRPRASALVDVAGEADAREIIREFNGYVLDAHRLRVEMAREPAIRAYVAVSEALVLPRSTVGGLKGRTQDRPHRPERSPGR